MIYQEIRLYGFRIRCVELEPAIDFSRDSATFVASDFTDRVGKAEKSAETDLL